MQQGAAPAAAAAPSAAPPATPLTPAPEQSVTQPPVPAVGSTLLNSAVPAAHAAPSSSAPRLPPGPSPIRAPLPDKSASAPQLAPGSLTPIPGPAPTPHHVTVERGCEKKTRLVWTPELHTRFLLAVEKIGLRTAVPRTILQVMDVGGLTRENIASHLQKYRRLLERKAGLSGPVASKDWPKLLQAQAQHLAQVKKQVAEGGAGSYESMALTQPMPASAHPIVPQHAQQAHAVPPAAPPPRALAPAGAHGAQMPAAPQQHVAAGAVSSSTPPVQPSLAPVGGAVSPQLGQEASAARSASAEDLYTSPGIASAFLATPTPGVCPVPAQVPPHANVPMEADDNGSVRGVPLPQPFTPPLMCVMPQPDGSPMLLPMLPAMYMAACGKNTAAHMGRVPLPSAGGMATGGAFGWPLGASPGADPACHHPTDTTFGLRPPVDPWSSSALFGDAAAASHSLGQDGPPQSAYGGGGSSMPQASHKSAARSGSRRRQGSAPSTLPPLVPDASGLGSLGVQDHGTLGLSSAGGRSSKATGPRRSFSAAMVACEGASLQEPSGPSLRARSESGNATVKREDVSDAAPGHGRVMHDAAAPREPVRAGRRSRSRRGIVGLEHIKVEEGTATSTSGDDRRSISAEGREGGGASMHGHGAAADDDMMVGIEDEIKGRLSLDSDAEDDKTPRGVRSSRGAQASDSMQQ